MRFRTTPGLTLLLFLLAAVFAGGYQAGTGTNLTEPSADVFHLTQATADPGRVMLYVSSDEGGKFKQTLDQAQAYLDRYGNDPCMHNRSEGVAG